MITGVIAAPIGLNHPVTILYNTSTGNQITFRASHVPGMVLDPWINTYPTALEAAVAVGVGDFDYNGLPDIVTADRVSRTPRLFMQRSLNVFEDVTALGSPVTPGSAIEHQIEWTSQWTNNGLVVADLNLDGVHDVYIPNFDGVTHAELYLTPPPPAGAAMLTQTELKNGGVPSGTVLKLFGVNLGGVTAVKLERGSNSFEMPIDGLVAGIRSDRQLWFKLPGKFSIGFGLLRAKVRTASGWSRPIEVTHLNVAPQIRVTKGVAGAMEIEIDDPDGPTDLDFTRERRLQIQVTRGQTKIEHTAASADWQRTATTTGALNGSSRAGRSQAARRSLAPSACMRRDAKRDHEVFTFGLAAARLHRGSGIETRPSLWPRSAGCSGSRRDRLRLGVKVGNRRSRPDD